MAVGAPADPAAAGATAATETTPERATAGTTAAVAVVGLPRAAVDEATDPAEVGGVAALADTKGNDAVCSSVTACAGSTLTTAEAPDTLPLDFGRKAESDIGVNDRPSFAHGSPPQLVKSGVLGSGP